MGAGTRVLGAGLIAAALVSTLVGCTTTQPIPRLSAGTKQELQVAEKQNGPTEAAQSNIGIHVVQKKGAIPNYLVPARWSTTTKDPSATRIPISWDYGSCGKPNRETDVYVEQNPQSVVIDVWDDTRLDIAPGTSCAGVGLRGTWTVTLAKPLGSRSIDEHVVSRG